MAVTAENSVNQMKSLSKMPSSSEDKSSAPVLQILQVPTLLVSNSPQCKHQRASTVVPSSLVISNSHQGAVLPTQFIPIKPPLSSAQDNKLQQTGSVKAVSTASHLLISPQQGKVHNSAAQMQIISIIPSCNSNQDKLVKANSNPVAPCIIPSAVQGPIWQTHFIPVTPSSSSTHDKSQQANTKSSVSSSLSLSNPGQTKLLGPVSRFIPIMPSPASDQKVIQEKSKIFIVSSISSQEKQVQPSPNKNTRSIQCDLERSGQNSPNLSECSSLNDHEVPTQCDLSPTMPPPSSDQEQQKITSTNEKKRISDKSGHSVPASHSQEPNSSQTNKLSFKWHIRSYKQGKKNEQEKQNQPDSNVKIHSSTSDDKLESIDSAENNVVPKKKRYSYTCKVCQHSFTKKPSIRRHVKRVHGDENLVDPIQANQICPICESSNRSLFTLIEHIESMHPEVSLKTEELTFRSFEDFENWKTEIETQSKSRFINRSARRKLCGGRFAFYYYCHRSGKQYNLKTNNRRRRLKHGGSVKMGKTCPAFIRMYCQQYDESLKIRVTYQSVHVGHQTDLKLIPLTKNEKFLLAEQMALGVPKSELIEKIKKEYPPTERLSLISRKDLHNICREFNIIQEREPLKLLRAKLKAQKIANIISSAEKNTDAETDTPETVEEEIVFDDALPEFSGEADNRCSSANDSSQQAISTDPGSDNSQVVANSSPFHSFSSVRVVETDVETVKAALYSDFQNLLEESQSLEQLQVLQDVINATKEKWLELS